MHASSSLLAALALVVAQDGPVERLARFVSPELRAHDARSAELRRKLQALPPAPEEHSPAREGWHSTFNFNPRREESRSVTIDLGKNELFDSVVLIPVRAGYGFPVRFRVEVAGDPGFAAPATLADRSAADFGNPGSLPVFLETPEAYGRYVRVTATRLFSRGDAALFALGELMVWRKTINLTVGKAASASGTYENAPTWELANLNDGQSVLGPPVRRRPIPGHGYHSKVALREDEEKWVQLDLGASVPIDEIRIYAARPADFPDRSGFGFPRLFRVAASDTPEFVQSRLLAEYRDAECVNPGDNPFLVAGGGGAARYVRMTATRLWERHHDFVFALSELQVFSGGENVARRATPSALDSIRINRWSLACLNDGFNGEGELLDWPGWLRGLSRRREIVQELELREAAREPLLAASWRRLGAWMVGALTACAALGLLLALRQRAGRRRELTRLRRRIAADLHDEIGSNLGSIALLASLAAEQLPGGARSGVAEIQQIAQETAESMRDIVWLMRPGPRLAADLLTRLREIAAQQLGGLAWQMETGRADGPFALEFERELLLLFKEALHNIRKHARATSVSIDLVQTGRAVCLTVADDGQGFDVAAPASGAGLASMRHRAAQLGARFTIQSQPGQGTVIKLEAQLS